MSTPQEHVLELALRVWRNSEPEPEEVDAAVRRVRRRLRARRGAKRSRAPSLLVAFGLVLLGALAYAAVRGGGAGEQPEQPRSQTADTLPARGGTMVVAPPEREPPASQKRKLELLETARSDLSSASPPVATPRRAPGAAGVRAATPELESEPPSEPASPEQDSTTWRDVDSALGARDDKRAARALTELARSGERSTRLKARLGLAQLAASRGDCTSARAIATGIIAEPGVDAALARRAHRVASTCR
jgi:hypothetical protein